MGGQVTASEIVFVVKLMFLIYYYLPKCLFTHLCSSYVKALLTIKYRRTRPQKACNIHGTEHTIRFLPLALNKFKDITIQYFRTLGPTCLMSSYDADYCYRQPGKETINLKKSTVLSTAAQNCGTLTKMIF
jgi:hypothetical protein